MPIYSPVNEYLWLNAAAIALAVLTMLAALWAATGPASAVWRTAPLALLLAALVPTGAYELAILAATQAVVIVVAVRVWLRWRRASGESADAEFVADSPRLRLSLIDGLLWLGLISAVLALLRLDSRHDGFPGFTATMHYLLVGLAIGVWSLAVPVLFAPRSGFRRRAVALVLACAALGFVAYMLGQYLVLRFPDSALPWRERVMVAFAWVAAISITGGVAAFGWRWPQSPITPSGRLGRAFARITLAGWTAVAVAMLAGPYVALLPPALPPQPPLPKPNAYMQIVALEPRINWAHVPNQDNDLASVADCAAFAQDNVAAFEAFRALLAQPGRAPIDFYDPQFTAPLREIQAMRSWTQALYARQKGAAGNQRYPDVMDDCLDGLRLANHTRRGGVVIHELVASAVQGVAVDPLAKNWQSFDVQTLERFQQTAPTILADAEPLDEIAQRDHYYELLAPGWTGRLLNWLSPQSYFPFVARARWRLDAILMLMVTDAGLRRCIADHGHPPDGLSELVPKYLASVPNDPYGSGPFVYRRNGDTYLLYSVGGNGVDDGGERVTQLEATNEHKGDLFFDAPYVDEP